MPTFLLADTPPSPNALQMGIPILHIESAVIGNISSLLEQSGLEAPIALLCDTRTYAVAGEAIEKQLGMSHGQTVNLGLNVKPLLAHAHHVQNALQHANSLLVVGSGTLNDIAKLAAFRENKPYAVFATAASMNGYASPTSSLYSEGRKQSLPARPPALILADMDVIAEAPQRLSQAGLADTLCRPCVQADMLLAHMVLGTSYQPETFSAMRDFEPYLLSHSARLAERDPEYLKQLLLSLIAGGNAMAQAESSAPASQGEHMIAHTLEALHPTAMEAHYHGEHIAVTSVSSLRIQHYLMQSRFTLQATTIDMERLRHAFGEPRARMYSTLALQKRLDKRAAEKANRQLTMHWEAFRLRFQTITIPPETLETALANAGIATDPENLGITRHDYDEALLLAPYTRERFTFLDIAAMRREQQTA
jgi:glycerol-1-phosphate dehydrogenase [NAD(P)+]